MRVTLWSFLSAIAISTCRSEQSASIDDRIAAAVTSMQSASMATRHAAFDDLIQIVSDGKQLGPDPAYAPMLGVFLRLHPDKTDSITLGLISLLKADDDAFVSTKTARGTYTENDTEHWARAIDIVSCLNDERTIPALVGAMTNGGGSCKGLLKYGQRALGPVRSKLRDPNPLVRSHAVSMATAILRLKDDFDSHAQTLDIIRAAIADPEFLVRSSAVSAIEGLADRARFVPALQEILEHDPFIVPGQTKYPLRMRGAKLLQEIANH
jgi:hypothetical protein